MIKIIICGIIISAILIIEIINIINKRKIIKQFKQGNVLVSGLKGQGKDLLFCWIVNKRKENYISNVEYSDPKKKYKCFKFNTKVMNIGGNTYESFINNEVREWEYPYPDGIDYYISDAGIYFPAQSHKELDKNFKGAPLFEALLRHLGDCNFHTNSQRQNRVWDKIREQSDQFIVMTGATVKLGFIIIRWTEYSKVESAEAQLKKPKFGIGKNARMVKQSFEANNGTIKNRWLIGRLPYNYDSRRFKKIIEEGGCK